MILLTQINNNNKISENRKDICDNENIRHSNRFMSPQISSRNNEKITYKNKFEESKNFDMRKMAFYNLITPAVRVYGLRMFNCRSNKLCAAGTQAAK